MEAEFKIKKKKNLANIETLHDDKEDEIWVG